MLLRPAPLCLGHSHYSLLFNRSQLCRQKCRRLVTQALLSIRLCGQSLVRLLYFGVDCRHELHRQVTHFRNKLPRDTSALQGFGAPRLACLDRQDHIRSDQSESLTSSYFGRYFFNLTFSFLAEPFASARRDIHFPHVCPGRENFSCAVPILDGYSYRQYTMKGIVSV